MLKTINGGIEPTKATKYSVGIDLYANEDVVIGAGETKIIGLGVKIDLDFIERMFIYDDETFQKFLEGHYLELHPRSSLRAKGLIAGVGIIDLDYPSEIKIIIHNLAGEIELLDRDILLAKDYGTSTLTGFENDNFEIKKGDKIAQILLKEHKGYLFGIESDEERKGGFGSTDKENSDG